MKFLIAMLVLCAVFALSMAAPEPKPVFGSYGSYAPYGSYGGYGYQPVYSYGYRPYGYLA